MISIGNLETTLKDDEMKEGHRELGGSAIWSLSSSKVDHPINNLRDNNLETYWQSDGTQPHFVNIHFDKKVSVSEVLFYVDYKLDESYTPARVLVRAGTMFSDLVDVKAEDLEEPKGWIRINTASPSGNPIRTYFLQLAVISNHNNGRDCHIRQIKVYGPQESLITHSQPSDSVTIVR